MALTVAPVRKLMVANRGEIAIRVFRSAVEMGISTVAIYAYEDRFSLHRLKADEAYQIGKPGKPLKSYLNIEEIVRLAKAKGVDAIHPGYGFLSENAEFARACRDAGVIFVGPTPEILEKLGDKVAARKIARDAGVTVLSGSDDPLLPGAQARELANQLGFPVLVKAAMGGGGRGMRVVRAPEQLEPSIESARREAENAFGCPDVFLEKFIERARHIEVQVIGDRHGNVVHLFERDCSVQRRYQKVIEIAPATNLDPVIRDQICQAALKIVRSVQYQNAGTVEFLLDVDTGRFHFIEVNPRIQVEHTVTEMVTGVDLIKSQILVAQGLPLDSEEIGLGKQEEIRTMGYAIQCRVTTEDPVNDLVPDHGRISHYRSPGGFGIRLDGGTTTTGAIVTPFYDSLLVKVCSQGRRFSDAIDRMSRALKEFRVRGVKTNIPFLLNVLEHNDFKAGRCTTRFIDQTRELYDIKSHRDRATKLLTYLAELAVEPENKRLQRPPQLSVSEPKPPFYDPQKAVEPGIRDVYKELGAEKFSAWVREQKRLLVTDTTFRDGHQSLFATRMRTRDMLRAAKAYSALCPQLFSIEMWGGATFDSAMRFLKEDPWDRLTQMREAVPNILFQMLLRGANTVGYASYPNNVVHAFVKESAQAGIDVFRVFDSLNWVPNMRVAIEAIRDSDAICEAAICYTGDILDPNRPKYDLKYYIEMAKELEKLGANIIAIKDMAGLCKPYAARLLIRELRQEVGLPIHFHTHDIGGFQSASILQGVEVGLDIADGAMASMSGLTSQPNLNALVDSLKFHERNTGLDSAALMEINRYWGEVRSLYKPFESTLNSPSAEVYAYEMPGGQYTNLQQQATALGLSDRWEDVCRMYAEVNMLFGDIVKVTPSSKVVGDMALFMVGGNLTVEDVLDPNKETGFPESVVEMMDGRLGQPPGGFPEAIQNKVLKGRKPSTSPPGDNAKPVDLDAKREEAAKLLGREARVCDALSLVLFEKVFTDLVDHQERYADTSILPTTAFFYGVERGVETQIEIEPGKTLLVKLQTISDPHEDGKRTVFFELNGQPREIQVADPSMSASKAVLMANANDPLEIGSPLPGVVVNIAVEPGNLVVKGSKLAVIEAMKMETVIYAEQDGKITEVFLAKGRQVQRGELLMRFEKPKSAER